MSHDDTDFYAWTQAQAEAAAAGKEPRHLVEECLWHVLSDGRSATP